MSKIRDLPTIKRTREKLPKKRAEALIEPELLTIILGKGLQKNGVLSL